MGVVEVKGGVAGGVIKGVTGSGVWEIVVGCAAVGGGGELDVAVDSDSGEVGVGDED